MKTFFTLLLVSIWCMVASAQTGTVSGKVTGADGEVLIGANIIVKDANAGTISDADGTYELRLPAGSHTIVVSYTGYTDQSSSVTLSGGSTATLNFTLDVGTELDVVVISGSKNRKN